jgi:hypothetical protein
MKKLIAVAMLSLIMAIGATIPASAATYTNQHMNPVNTMEQESKEIRVQLSPVGDSGVSGLVHLTQLGNQNGTHILVVAFGLKPGNQYISLYYDNHVCELEPYSSEDVIGDNYKANAGSGGVTRGNADDDLDEINSVSVRQADDFTLVACANVHP